MRSCIGCDRSRRTIAVLCRSEAENLSPAPSGDVQSADSAATAYRRLVGTSIAAMSEERSGILSGNAVERGSECLFQSLDGARGDPAEVGLYLGPARLDRAEVRAVGWQIAIRKA